MLAWRSAHANYMLPFKITIIHLLYRTVLSWTKEGVRSLFGKERKQTKLKDRLPCPELWWVSHISADEVSYLFPPFVLFSACCRTSSKQKTTLWPLMLSQCMMAGSQLSSSSSSRGGLWKTRRKASERWTPGAKLVRWYDKRKITLQENNITGNITGKTKCQTMPVSHFFPSTLMLAHITQEKFDASLMHAMPEVAAQERMVDNGGGQVEVKY